MLILSRRESECIHLGDDIVVTIVRVNGDKVRIGVQAPPHVKILRTELELNWETRPLLEAPNPMDAPIPMEAPSPIRRAA